MYLSLPTPQSLGLWLCKVLGVLAAVKQRAVMAEEIKQEHLYITEAAARERANTDSSSTIRATATLVVSGQQNRAVTVQPDVDTESLPPTNNFEARGFCGTYGAHGTTARSTSAPLPRDYEEIESFIPFNKRKCGN